MNLRRVVFGLFLASLVLSSGCFFSRNKCSRYNRTRDGGFTTGMASGCNECSGYANTEMFGTPVHSNAMLQAPGQQQVDERLNAPAKQNPYEGPAKK